MPRQARIDFPGLLHHVMVRGIERRAIFGRLSDYSDFVNRLASLCSETNMICYAWALMRNHVHLLLQTGPVFVSTFMQRLLTGYATRFNLLYGRVGHLFQNRYKDIVCEDEPYFMELVRYIHLNPVRAGIIRSPEALATYPWTGHSAVMGRVDRSWQATGAVLERFGKTPDEMRQRYEAFIVDGWNKKRQQRFEGGGLVRSADGRRNAVAAQRNGNVQPFDERILGGGAFVESILQQAEQIQTNALDFRGMDLEQMMGVIANVADVPKHLLIEPGKGRAVSRAKAMLLFAGTQWLGYSLKKIGEMVKISSGASSRALRKGREFAARFNLEECLKRQWSSKGS